MTASGRAARARRQALAQVRRGAAHREARLCAAKRGELPDAQSSTSHREVPGWAFGYPCKGCIDHAADERSAATG